jgi:hypothetical protein
MFDPKCYDLAENFLQDVIKEPSKDLINSLAQEIQSTIEDFLRDIEEDIK